jgi:hypothetical protein
MMTLAVNPKYYADSGTVLGKISGTHIEGFRDVKIGNAQAWYYPDDRVLVLWECFLHDFVRDLPLLFPRASSNVSVASY